MEVKEAICKVCKKAYGKGWSGFVCEGCNKYLSATYRNAPKYCNDCAESKSVCKFCGTPIELDPIVNTRKKYVGKLYGETITSDSMRGLKIQASKIANGYCKSFDEMTVEVAGRIYKYSRTNKVYPDGTVMYGQWG